MCDYEASESNMASVCSWEKELVHN